MYPCPVTSTVPPCGTVVLFKIRLGVTGAALTVKLWGTWGGVPVRVAGLVGVDGAGAGGQQRDARAR